MINRLIVTTIFLFFAMPAYSLTDMCSGGQATFQSSTVSDLIGQAQARAGDEVNPSEAFVIRATTVRDALAAETIVKSQRLSGNGVYVLKATRTIKGNPVPIEEYAELVPIEGLDCNGEQLAILRPTDPEQIARKRSANLAPNDVLAVGLKAYGEGALMLGGMMEKMAEESAFGPVFSGLVGGHGSDRDRTRSIMDASSSANGCWSVLGLMSGQAAYQGSNSDMLPTNPNALPPRVMPWESANPMLFMMGPACMAIAMSERMGVDLPEAAAIMWAEQEAAFEGAQTHPPVVEEIDNKTAYRFDIDGLNLTQSTADLDSQPDDDELFASEGFVPEFDSRPSSFTSYQPPAMASHSFTGNSFTSAGSTNTQQASMARSKANSASSAGSMTIHKISLWIDAQKIVRLKTRMEGVMQQDGQSRDIFMETEYKDFKTVPGTSLYEPYREIMRVGGVMDAKQQAEMQEAVSKLDEYEQKMASMPASQRAMMEKMIGPQIEQIRSMASGGAVEFEIITTSIEINPDLMAPATMDMTPNVVQIVQLHLVTLGYDPGNTDGELTKQTVVAISKYQAAHGMEVTGQATPQLAGVLAAAVDAMN